LALTVFLEGLYIELLIFEEIKEFQFGAVSAGGKPGRNFPKYRSAVITSSVSSGQTYTLTNAQSGGLRRKSQPVNLNSFEASVGLFPIISSFPFVRQGFEAFRWGRMEKISFVGEVDMPGNTG